MSTEGHRRALVVAAGFPEEHLDDVVDSIDRILMVYKELAASNKSIDKSQRKILAVAKKAAELRALIADLPISARPYLGFPLYKPSMPALTTIIAGAEKYSQLTNRKSGRPANLNFRAMLLELVALWSEELPTAAGIARDGSGPDEGRDLYKGPLFDFTRDLLDAESVEYHSEEALGREIWDLWKLTRQVG